MGEMVNFMHGDGPGLQPAAGGNQTWNAAESPPVTPQRYVVSIPGIDDGRHVYEVITWIAAIS